MARRSAMPGAVSPISLPDSLLGEAPSVKLLYLWLAQHGKVDLPQRDIAAALGITQANVSLAVQRLLELGLVTRDPDEDSRARKTLSAVVEPIASRGKS